MANGEKSTEKKNRRRTAYFKVSESELDTKVGIEIRAWDKDGVFVGRLEINRAGLEAFVGSKGKKSVANLSWEKVFARLAREEE